MLSYRILIVVLAVFLVPSLASARGGGGGHGGGHSGGGHSGGGHSSSSPHGAGGHPSGSPRSGSPGGVHSHSDSAPRGIAPKSGAPKASPPAISHESKPKSQFTNAKPPATKCESCPRDAHGKIQRSEVAKRDFMKQSGYPQGRPGYVVDHIVPLAKGGKDAPSNMQWQAIAEAREG